MLTTPATYCIVVQGRLGPEWSAWLGGLSLSWQEPDQTVLLGQVTDQTALHGLLNTIGDLGLPLLEVLRLPAGTGLPLACQPGTGQPSWHTAGERKDSIL